MKNETKSIRTQSERTVHKEHSVPLYLTSSFMFDNAEHARALFADEVEGNIYSRYSNPNTTELINKMVNLEKAEAGFAFASGMAAVFTGFAALLSSGDHVLASRALFGSSHQILTKILSKWGIEYTYVDTIDQDNWEMEVKPNTKMLFIETPSNPGLDIIDLEKAGELCKKHNLIYHVDNCFATPIIQNPIDYGADLVSHSATKYIDGQGRVIGGIAVGKQSLIDEIRFFARQTGPSLSPFNAWILSKSLETLQLRMEKHCSNAFGLAEKLSNHSEIVSVKYPFLNSHPQFELAKKQMKMGGGIVTINLKGDSARANRFVDAVEMISRSSNLGDTRTIITHPASTTHSKLSEGERSLVGIEPETIRISVGLENLEDILTDLKNALEKSK
ncbi:MAG: aminotransferase class I/II-fold pyridoxal phosphate-dependent enzyme [Melioribacteraceae bacterium]|nr:aminotransferase class I/II-fold pyridoxal phosphate-dependent enzyme [Melioribacteraceae bacterium]